jgi:hypothetical protein
MKKQPPTVIESRKVPTTTELTVRGESHPFRTSLKTCKKSGVRYYGPTIMPSDLGILAFSEDLDEEEGTQSETVIVKDEKINEHKSSQ